LTVWSLRHILRVENVHAMATKFADVMREIEAEARAEGPQAVRELEAFRVHFRLGRQIAEARRARRLTQKQVAKIARIDQADVSDIERGASNPTLNKLDAIACAVGMELELTKKRHVRSVTSRARRASRRAS
jgi:DNA-binding XRE family transcriptional regulator